MTKKKARVMKTYSTDTLPQPGERVTLDMDNAPVMTVVDLRGASSQEAHCRWFDTIGALHERTFLVSDLHSAEEQEEPPAEPPAEPPIEVHKTKGK